MPSFDDFLKQYYALYEIDDPLLIFDREFRSDATRYIVVAAQNATPVHTGWWPILRYMAAQLDAELVVIPFRYKNPTSKFSGSQKNDEWWDPTVREFLFNRRHEINKNLMILGDIKIQPTATSPLTGADALSLASSGIIGHTKLQFKTVPTPQNRMAKILTTTGACTIENYSDTRAGVIGDFHHSLSAVMVEVKGSHFYLRQLHYDRRTDSCTDLNTRWFADRRETSPPALALVMGDTHVDFMCPKVREATFGTGGLIELLRPQNLVYHDTLDAYSCSPHHEGNPFITQAKRQSGMNNVRQEVSRATSLVIENAERFPFLKSHIVDSNHDDMLTRWIKRADWKQDPTNADFYLDTALRMLRGTRMGPSGTETPSAFGMYMREAARRAGLSDRIHVLERNESLLLGKVECGMHGHAGPNGSRGSIRNLRRIGVRSIKGHDHMPGIDEGCYSAGTSSILDPEYVTGPSGWLNAHVLLNADSKRQILIVVDGEVHL